MEAEESRSSCLDDARSSDTSGFSVIFASSASHPEFTLVWLKIGPDGRQFDAGVARKQRYSEPGSNGTVDRFQWVRGCRQGGADGYALTAAPTMEDHPEMDDGAKLDENLSSVA